MTLEEKKKEVFEKLQREWNIEDFLLFNEFDIGEKLQKHPFILMQWQQKLENEKFQLDKIQSLMEKVQGEAFERIQKENDLSLKTSEIEKYYLPRDEKVKKVKDMMLLQQFIVSYFEANCKAISSMGWSMKQWIDNKKIS